MKAARLVIVVSVVSVLLTSIGQAGAIKKSEIEYQTQNFRQWWDTELQLQFSELPTSGKVPNFRVPYSGHDYPDRGGGTINALRGYDRAFHQGRPLATEWEREDTGQNGRQRRPEWVPGAGFFRNLRAGIGPRESDVPGWYGHCNGWTAAAIRHAAPEHSVRKNGVLFSPADIKGLLAEIYMYSDSEFLGGEDFAINPALMHIVVTNWLGRGSHPVAIETTLGEEKWNYPAYAYATTFAERDSHTIEVKMNIAYSLSTRQEFNISQHIKRIKYFHYELKLDDDGKIVGGEYYRDSSRLDMLWIPMHPAQGGEEGNERGNPHVDVKEVLALWRSSVSQELRSKWFNIDPTDEDRIAPVEDQVAPTNEEETATELAES
ncbi:MAG TPA: hypothetical protein QF564_25065 [Pirellulaceae bacterium]|nr:hypothetical protein [Pirellulaceae bacterium]